MESLSATRDLWSPVKKFLFRFFFVYFFVYSFPFPFDSFDFTKPIAQPLYNFWDWLVLHVGEKWYHIRTSTAFPMFDKMDDSGYGLVFTFLNLQFSAVTATCWTLADHRRKNYEKLYQWLRLYLRYYLAASLFGYGFLKVFPSQFEPITAANLAMPVGDQSAMMLAWNFMGYSTVMMRFTGIAEVGAGILLLFRRTTTFGAILSSCVFSYVVLMDFCFNVPVRLFASHLLVISIFLVLEDRHRLLHIFFLNKPTEAVEPVTLVTHPAARKALIVAQAVVVLSLLYANVTKSIDEEKTIGHKTPPVPLYGIYNTIYFIRNKDTIPPLETDSLRWKQLVVDGGSWKQPGIIQFSTDKRNFYTILADTAKSILKIQSFTDITEKYFLHYIVQDGDHLLLKGRFKQDSIETLMRKYDLNNYLLHKEKFTWITN